MVLKDLAKCDIMKYNYDENCHFVGGKAYAQCEK